MQRPKRITALVTMNRNPGNSRRWHAHARVAVVVHPVGVAREGAHSASRRSRTSTATPAAEGHGRANGNAARPAIEDAAPIGNASHGEPAAGEGNMAQVVNGLDRVQRKRDGRVVGLREGEVYIGQPSRWGNPFELRNGSRDLAVAQYRTWLWAEIRAGRVRLDDLAALHGLTLVCWCAPKACHGHVLARAAAWAEGQRIEAEIDRHDQAQAEAFVDADELDHGAWAEHLRRLEAEAQVRVSPAASRSSANEHGLAQAEADRERWIRS